MTSSRLTAEEQAVNGDDDSLLEAILLIALFPPLAIIYLWEKLRGKNE